MTIEEIGEEIDAIKADHLVIDSNKQVIRCNICGAEDELRVGISLMYWINLMRAFKLTHGECGYEEAEDL